jgi:hypothetical protein
MLVTVGYEDRTVTARDPRAGDGEVRVFKGHRMPILDMDVSW